MPSNETYSMEDIKLDPIVQTLTIIQLTYGVPSVVLMICFFILMRRIQIYSNSFYRLVQLDLLTNILLYFNTWLGIRMAMHPSLIFILKFIEQSVPGFLTWCRYFTWWFMHIQFLTASVLSVHRITAILFAARYEKFWTRYYFICGILFAIYSFLPSLLWFGFTNEVVIFNETLSIIKHSETVVKATNVTAIFSITYFIVIFSLGVVTSCMFTSKAKEFSSTYEKVSKKLTKIALTYCFVYAGILCWTVITALHNQYNFLPSFVIKINQTFLVFSSDLMTLSLPYILLIFDTNVKKQVFPKKPKIMSNFGFSSFLIS